MLHRIEKLFCRKLVAGVLGSGLLLGSTLAHATHKIYSPTIEPGEFELEMRGHTTFDSNAGKDDQQAYKLSAGYGIAQRWYTELGTTLAKNNNGDLESQELFWENIIQLTEQGEHWLDAGLYLEYAVARGAGTPDELESKLLLEKSVGAFVHTANMTTDHQVKAHRQPGLCPGAGQRRLHCHEFRIRLAQ